MTMGNAGAQFGDTTLTKVFVGGLAWETQKEAMNKHFEKYGEILEAVIISDKVTGRSKGYGFVTFKDAEDAKKACEDATPVINGRRANCNLASLGARRPRSASATPQQGSTVGSRPVSSTPQNAVQWYYSAGAPSPFHHPHHGLPFPAYGYSPSYIADMSYNPKVSYSGSYVYPNQSMMPVYPYYQVHQSQAMGVPTHVYPPTTNMATIVSNPSPIPPNAGMRVQLKVSE
ncbi:probable RNA-binding protein ARP1 [Aristolochia californica]|uniref:probable RNA-binding protein ARP1 n=1 Tax=Aristolochia californica TaxID=171875 RepID=UPI0035D6FF44